MKSKPMSWTLLISVIPGILVIVAGIAQYREKLIDNKNAQKNFDAVLKENKNLKGIN